MGKIIVEIMPKDEILDPQGKAIAGALKRLNIDGVKSVRQGKRFELEFDGDITAMELDQAKNATEKLLINPIIEKVVRIVEDK